MTDQPRAEHVGVVRCGKALRHEHHRAHTFTFQASDDSPEQVDADCPGWECGAIFHHTTAMGYCSRCGGSWKHRHLPVVNEQSRTDAEPSSADVGPGSA